MMTIRQFPAALLCAFFAAGACAQEAKPADSAAAAEPLAALAWMRGCWQGKVNQRDYIEQWTAPAAGLMLGLGHTVLNGKTASFEFMRIEARPDGKVAYIAQPSGQKESVFVYDGMTKEQDVELHTFSSPALAFPARIVYRHTPGNMMFAQLEGKVDGNDRKVIYPFRPVDCMSGKTL